MPGQFDLLRNLDIPRADEPPIEPTATEPHYME